MNRIAIVSGGGQGIGAAIAARLVADGDTVAILDWNEDAARTRAEEITATGGTAIAIGCDVSDADSVATAVETTVQRLGPPQILVNNAGIIRDNLLFRMTADDWEQVMAVNLRGAFLLSRAVQSHMTSSGFGRIVNISSVSALGNRGQANYSAAKAGLIGFSKTLAMELGKFGVTVNAVAPGYIVTPMIEQTAARVGQDLETFLEGWLPLIPVGRVGTVDDIANAVAFFRDERAGFVSGQVLYVSGGPAG